MVRSIGATDCAVCHWNRSKAFKRAHAVRESKVSGPSECEVSTRQVSATDATANTRAVQQRHDPCQYIDAFACENDVVVIIYAMAEYVELLIPLIGGFGAGFAITTYAISTSKHAPPTVTPRCSPSVSDYKMWLLFEDKNGERTYYRCTPA